MRLPVLITLTLISSFSIAQSVSNENVNHLYDPRKEVNLDWVMARQEGKMVIAYALKSTSSTEELFLMKWDKRKSYSQRDGDLIQLDSIRLAPGETKKGELKVDLSDEPWLLTGTVTKVTSSETWIYPALIEKNYPVNGFMLDNGEKVFTSYLKTKQPYTIQGSTQSADLFCFYYKKDFPSAFPPFTKSTAGADPILLSDSTFTIRSGESLTFKKEGLYLFQTDTTSAEGIAFHVGDGAYPRYTRIEDLVPPLIFICTKEEFKSLEDAKGDKVQFDKTILSITRDKDRAKKFMRSYYGRVELANQYFTSYKEGWKTDRGMIYIIFGLPDEIRRTDQNEIWYYKNSRTKFVFIKKGSVYDPDYFVLMRDDRFTELWYNTIDLWRKSRF